MGGDSAPEEIDMMERELLEKVLESGVKDRKEIIWNNIQLFFPTRDVTFLSYTFNTLIRRFISKAVDFRTQVTLALESREKVYKSGVRGRIKNAEKKTSKNTKLLAHYHSLVN